MFVVLFVDKFLGDDCRGNLYLYLARVLSDAFVDCIHDVPNAFPFSKDLVCVRGLQVVWSLVHLAMLVLSCSLFLLKCLSQKVFYGVWAL